jgi:hypothetical protein
MMICSGFPSSPTKFPGPALIAAMLSPLVAVAQVPHARPWAAYVVVPQTRAPMAAKGGVRVTEVEAGVVVARPGVEPGDAVAIDPGGAVADAGIEDDGEHILAGSAERGGAGLRA